MTRLTKTISKTELQKVKDLCKAQGFDYDKITLHTVSDVFGNIVSVETTNVKLLNILIGKGFT